MQRQYLPLSDICQGAYVLDNSRDSHTSNPYSVRGNPCFNSSQFSSAFGAVKRS